MDKIRVLLVGARELFRAGITRVLGAQRNIEVIATCSSGNEGLNKAKELKPDIILLDSDISDCNYLDMTRSISESLTQVGIIVLSSVEEYREFILALKVGVRSFFSKSVSLEELIRTIESVHAGQVIMPQPMATRLLNEFTLLEEQNQAIRGKRSLGLSKREEEVIRLVAQGCTNTEIARALFISENTTKVHVSKILQKLKVNNRQQAAVLAIEKGIVSISRVNESHDIS